MISDRVLSLNSSDTGILVCAKSQLISFKLLPTYLVDSFGAFEIVPSGHRIKPSEYNVSIFVSP